MTQNEEDYVVDLAKFLASKQKKMTFQELGAHLKRNDIRDKTGNHYAGGRGTAKKIADLYYELENGGKMDAARSVADAFVSKDGRPAFI